MKRRRKEKTSDGKKKKGKESIIIIIYSFFFFSFLLKRKTKINNEWSYKIVKLGKVVRWNVKSFVWEKLLFLFDLKTFNNKHFRIEVDRKSDVRKIF